MAGCFRLRRSLDSAARQVLFQVPDDQHANVHARTWPFTQAVIAIGIHHVIEGLAHLNQPINQTFNDLDMRVGFTGSRHDQQFAFESLSKIDRRGPLVAFRIDFAGSHVNLLEPSVVEVWLRLGHHCNPNVIDIRFAEQRVKGVRTTAAPTPDADSGKINVRTCSLQFFERRRLLFGGDGPQAAEDRTTPGGTFGCWSSTVVDGDNEVAQFGNQLMKLGVNILLPGKII